MPMPHVWRCVPILALALMVMPATSARADETDEVDKEALVDVFVDQVSEHRRAKDVTALEADVKSAVKLYKQLEGDDRDAEAARKDLYKCLGILATTYKDKALRKALIESFGAMGDKQGAKYVKPYLKEPRGQSLDPMLPVALKAAGEIACAKLVPPLLKMATKAKRTSIQISAMKALGKFGHCKQQRARILNDLVKHVRRYRPGPGRYKENKVDPSKGPIGANPGEGTRGRWQSLGAVLPPVLNELTGQNIPSLEDWITIVEDSGSRLDSMFVHDEEDS